MPRAKPSRAADIAAEDDTVDETPENATLAGPVADGIPEPVAEALAKRMGWTPKEDWTRDPEDWAPASQFLEKTATQVEDLRARNRRLSEEKDRAARAAADMLEDERRRAREEALRTIRTADDPEERARAANKLAENSGPPPETKAWLARNPWFDADPSAQALAVSVIQRAEREGANIPAALAAGEEEVRRRYPEHFGATETPRGEQRLSDVRRAAPNPPQVQQGSRAVSNGAPKEKGFADIPAADRQAFRTNLLKHLMAHGQTQEQAEARYASRYWQEGVLSPEERGDEKYPLRPTSSAVWAKRRGATRV